MFGMPLCPTCKELIPEGSERTSGAARCPRCGQVVLIGDELVDLPKEEGKPVPEKPIDEAPAERTRGNFFSNLPSADDVRKVFTELWNGRPSRYSRSSFVERWGRGYARDHLRKIAYVILLLPLGGVGLLIEQFQEGIPYLDNPPPSMSCRDLMQRGAPEKAYIELTDFHLETGRIVTDSNLLDADSWAKAFVPVVPAGTNKQQPIRVLLETEEATTMHRLEELQTSNCIHGQVLRGTDSMTWGYRLRLNSSYPNANLKKCFILKHKPLPSPRRTYLLIGLAIVMILSGGPIWYIAWRLVPPSKPVQVDNPFD